MKEKINLKFLFIPICILLNSCGQTKDLQKCKSDIVELKLAYEYEGQFGLDDMIFKFPELVQYDGKVITSKNYKKGVYTFNTLETEKLNSCGNKFSSEELLDFNDTFENLDSKMIIYRNKAFAGKGTTMLGKDSIEWKYHEFKYKIFKVKFERTFIGFEERTMVNIDRKDKTEDEVMTISCPIYNMSNITKVSEID